MGTYSLDARTQYDRESQRAVGLMAAQLDDQLASLKKFLGTTTIAELEWQPHPGMNTIGMLLAHNALVEVFWMSLAGLGLSTETAADKRIRAVIGIGGDDDGLPLPPEGTHPEVLRGRNLDDYLEMLDSARKETHKILADWTDASLDMTYSKDDHMLSRGWTLYHVLEHFICHYGQVRLLRRMIKDRGLV